MAVVKANAYGHGLLPVARALAGADSLAVARLPEGLALRDAGVEMPVVVLQGVFTGEQLDTALAQRLELVVHCETQAALLETAHRGEAVVWLKVDTGMRRMGFEPDRAGDIRKRLARCPAVAELRLMTHLANADDRNDPRTFRQLECFDGLLDEFDGEFSVANSAGILGWADAIRLGREPGASWVRAGIALYGASPFPETTGADAGLEAAMEFEAEVIALKSIAADEAVGYGGCWRAPRDTVLGIVSAGYADGYSRYLPSGTPLLLGDREIGLAGRVSMDSLAVDLGPDGAVVGDRVTLWGAKLPVERIAACAGTIPYTLLAGLTHRDAPEFID